MDKFEKLSDTEKETMEVVWKLDRKVTSTELLKIFNGQRGKSWSAQTISTFLSRIVDKGILSSEKQGRINYYEACISKDEYERNQAENILNKLYQGSLKNFLAALYYKKNVTEKDYEEINGWFSEK